MAISKYLQQAMDDIAVTKYLETVMTKFLEQEQQNGDISVTKFLGQAPNDVTVTKFLDAEDGIAVTKYLD